MSLLGHPAGAGLVAALTMFTTIPMPGVQLPVIDRRLAGRLLRMLPFVGVLVGLVAALPLLLATLRAPGWGGGLLGAVLALTAVAVITRGLHLDGLADTADGLGSRAPAAEALDIMRKSDIGPFGVLTVLFVVLIQVIALAAVSMAGLGVGVLALVLAQVVGRVGVVLAAGPDVPAGRSDGFGALVAGAATPRTRVVALAVVALVCAIPLSWSPLLSLRLLVAAVVGLVVMAGWRRHVVRRVGGVTGDVFGSIVELGCTAVLLTLMLL